MYKNVEEFKQKVDALGKFIESRITETEIAELISDGIVNEEEYFNSSPKILWILKEAYDDGDFGGGGWSLTKDYLGSDDLHNIAKSKNTYQPVIYATYGILNSHLWDDMKYIREDIEMVKILRKVAVINVGKLPAQKSTSYFRLVEIYNQNRDLLLKQIETYNPDIIIGGSTLELFREDLNLSDEEAMSVNNITYWIKNNKIYIDAKHPAQRGNREEYVDGIISAATKWREIQEIV